MVTFSVYLNGHVFVMSSVLSILGINPLFRYKGKEEELKQVSLLYVTVNNKTINTLCWFVYLNVLCFCSNSMNR